MIEYPKKSKFEGDLNSNEVHVNLEKWIDVLHENVELKDRLRKLELVTQPNPWQSWIHFSIMIDSYRIFPRAFITVYMILLYYSTVWFMELPEPSIAQAGLISTMVGAGAAWFGLYTRSHGDGE